jgi:outer membrane protein insertion porin family
LNIRLLLLFFVFNNFAYGSFKIKVEGNRKVGAVVISEIFKKSNVDFKDKSALRKVLRSVYDLGYFSDLSVLQDGQTIIVKVVEKPSVVEIGFEGLKAFKEDDFIESLQTKVYRIQDNKQISQDMSMILQRYKQKGFFLAAVSYRLESVGANEVKLIFVVEESSKVLVGDISVTGNKTFSQAELVQGFISQPFTRVNAISSRSIFNQEIVERDNEFLAYFYKDQGFSKVRVTNPFVEVDKDTRYARMRFGVEEGVRFYVRNIKVVGDVGGDLFTEQDILDSMLLKKGSLFKSSYFSRDIEVISDKYGNKGYAYTDVQPSPIFSDEEALVDITYDISKGNKVYFGNIEIKGNSKTRDNVIRREFKVNEGDLYNGINLKLSKINVKRLGFFEEVTVDQNPSEDINGVLDLELEVKEKSTGNINASIGYSPGGETNASWYMLGGLKEENQFGRAWANSYEFKWSGEKSYKIDVFFSDPRVNDSLWSLGVGFAYEAQETNYSDDISIPEKRLTASLAVGRTLFEEVRLSTSLRHRNIKLDKNSQSLIYEGIDSSGSQNSIAWSLRRKKVDNYIEPTEGTSVDLSYKIAGGYLQGNHNFLELTLDMSYYHPLDFADDFRTYFKLRSLVGFLWKKEGSQIPEMERYRLGGFEDLRGFNFWEVSPTEKRRRSPYGDYYDYHYGGDKKFLLQLEYFVPFISQVGLKFLTFADLGQVFVESEDITLKSLKSDVGFGFRWRTPVAPFRFEWAYPYDISTGKFGDLHFIFTVSK